jgi:hypothetical protein
MFPQRQVSLKNACVQPSLDDLRSRGGMMEFRSVELNRPILK